MEDVIDPRPPRRNPASEIITSGGIWKAVWFVAWPTAVNTLILSAYNVINRLFVGRLPNAEEALAAVGVGGAALMVQFALTFGISVGASALVARFVGAEQYEDADRATGQSLGLAAAVGVISAAPLILFARPIVEGIGALGPVAVLATDYTVIIAWFSLPLFLYFIAQAALRSAGDVRSPLYAGAATVAVNTVLDWILIFGVGPFPMLGVRGAAIATGASRVVGLAVSLEFLRRSVLRGSLRRMRPKYDWYARILRIGWPAVLQNLVWTVANVGFLRILGFLPAGEATPAIAALTVGIAIESVAFMPGIAYSTAATPLVGQNLGARKPDRAAHAAWVATGQAVFIMSSIAVLFFLAPKWLATMFTTERSVVPMIVSYLRINAVSEPFLALGMVLRGALQGAGETRIPFWLTVLSLLVIRMPLAWWLAVPVGLGAAGAWIAMCASTILSGLLVTAYFVTGRWREVKV